MNALARVAFLAGETMQSDMDVVGAVRSGSFWSQTTVPAVTGLAIARRGPAGLLDNGDKRIRCYPGLVLSRAVVADQAVYGVLQILAVGWIIRHGAEMTGEALAGICCCGQAEPGQVCAQVIEYLPATTEHWSQPCPVDCFTQISIFLFMTLNAALVGGKRRSKWTRELLVGLYRQAGSRYEQKKDTCHEHGSSEMTT